MAARLGDFGGHVYLSLFCLLLRKEKVENLSGGKGFTSHSRGRVVFVLLGVGEGVVLAGG